MSDLTTPLDSKAAVSEMQTLMTEITRALVDDPDAVRVETFT